MGAEETETEDQSLRPPERVAAAIEGEAGEAMCLNEWRSFAAPLICRSLIKLGITPRDVSSLGVSVVKSGDHAI
jgi:hypothetical protein